MSKIFYDHLLILEEIDIKIREISGSEDEKADLWKLVDDIINHRIMMSILDRLPNEHHHDFLSKFYEAPHDEAHINYLNERIEEKIENVIKREIDLLKSEILQEIRSLKKEK